jgi:SAM-dependent methyltransferase
MQRPQPRCRAARLTVPSIAEQNGYVVSLGALDVLPSIVMPRTAAVDRLPGWSRFGMREGRSNPFSDPAIVAGYQSWYWTTGRRAARLERELLRWVLARFPGASSILEVGCGTGEFTRWFAGLGYQAVGVDVSVPMLDRARGLGSTACVGGDATALPLEDHAFDLVAFITTLEFVQTPVAALAEAVRVARRGLVLGVINRCSALGQRYQRSGSPVWEAARLPSPAELRVAVLAAAGPGARVTYRTTLWPAWRRSLPLPWGGFIGMGVTL